MKKKLLVTGSAGLLGSALLKILHQKKQYHIRAVWHQNPPPFLFPEIEYIQGDLSDPHFCNCIAEDINDAVLAAAHTGGAAEARHSPWKQVNANLSMNIHLLEALARQNCLEKLIFISSATVYQTFEGHICEAELDLNLPPHPAHLGVGQVMRYLEQACQFWQRLSGARFYVVRASNIFGPYARFDPARSNFIPALIRKAVERQDPFEIWGNPAVIRDVIYSADFAEGVLALLNYAGPDYAVFNLGSGQQVSVQNVIDWVLQFAGHCPAEFRYLGEQDQTLPFRALDCSKIQACTGWSARTPVETGIRYTLEWWKENKDTWMR